MLFEQHQSEATVFLIAELIALAERVQAAVKEGLSHANDQKTAQRQGDEQFDQRDASIASWDRRAAANLRAGS